MAASTRPSTLDPLAKPFKSTRRPPATPAPPTTTDPIDERIFHNFSNYPFHQDAEFQSGLSAILGHPDTPASLEEVTQNADLVLQAQCFYFARQNNLSTPIDPTSYKSWLRLRSQGPRTTSPYTDTISPAHTRSSAPDHSSSVLNPSSHLHPPQPPPPTPDLPTTYLPTDPPPPASHPHYPTTFNHIVDLITRNQPIPGIETIPDIVLGIQNASDPNTVPKRRKPWEVAAGAAAQIPVPNEEQGSKEKRSQEEDLKDSEGALDFDPQSKLQPSQSRTEEEDATDSSPTRPPPPSGKPLYGGLLGPLQPKPTPKIESQNNSIRTFESNNDNDYDDVKPKTTTPPPPPQTHAQSPPATTTTTPSWQSVAEAENQNQNEGGT